MKHSIKEIKKKNQTRVTVIQRGGGEGGLTEVSYEEAPPQGPTPYPLYVPFLDRKGTPFVYPLVTNRTPFTYLILNAASSFNCC